MIGILFMNLRENVIHSLRLFVKKHGKLKRLDYAAFQVC